MPFATTDLENFVKELGLTGDKAKVVLDAIGSDEAVRNKFGEHVLRQADYSTKMNDLTKEKERLEADYASKKAKEDEFHVSVATWKTEAERKANEEVTKARREAEDKLLAARDKIRALATRNGIPEEEIKDLISLESTTRNEPPPRRDQPREEDGKYMSVEQFQRESRFYARLPGIQMALQDEYRRMFGMDAPAINWDKVIDTAQEKKVNLTAAFEEVYKIPEKRQELAEKKRTEDMDKARKEGAEAERSRLLAEHPEMASRSVTRERPGSPILERGRAQAAELAKSGKLPDRDGSRDTVSAAVQAFREGKYKQDAA